MDRDACGIKGEYLAAVYLEDKGFTILDKNVNYPKIGELDIVARKKNLLVIVEVKFRDSAKYGHPIEAVGKSKVRKIIKATERYLAEKNPSYEYLRFDVISIEDENIEHIEDAFYGYWH